jgi:2-hydroxy-6-oxonona-2,4-dienedioate hydrolase
MSVWTDFQGAGVQERYYQAGQIRTRVLEAGEGGRPLFLLHGTTGHAEAYCRNLAALSVDRRVMAIDMIGHGYSDRPDLDYGLDDFVGHLLDLADTIGAERIDISGESLGAMVAGWFAITHPDRVGKIVMSTGLLAASPEDCKDDVDRAIRLTDAVAEDFTWDTVRARMHFLVKSPEDMTDELVDIRYKIYTQPDMLARQMRTMRTVLSWLKGDAGQEYMAPGVMSRISCPTMIFWTTHNPLWYRSQAEQAAKEIPDARYELLDCGHWPQFERAEEANRLHRDFFAADSARPGLSSDSS